MDIRQLRYAIRLGETGNLRKAAELEFIAPSAMSLHLRRLESDIGAELFTRVPSGLVPTAAGEHFITEAQTLLNGLETLRHDTRAVATPRRKLTVGFFGGAVNELTHMIFDGIVIGVPEHDLRFVELSMAGQFDGLLTGEIDIALMCLPANDDRLVATPLFEEPRLVAVSAKSDLAAATDLSCEDIVDEAFAVPVASVPHWWSSYWALDDVRGQKGRVGATVTTVGEAMAAVAYSGSIDTVPSSAARCSPHPGVSYRPLSDGGVTTTGLVRRSANSDPALSRLEAIGAKIAAEMISVVPEARTPGSMVAA